MDALSTFRRTQETDENLREVFSKHFGAESEDPSYKAWALYGVDVATKLCNALIAAKNPKAGRTLTAFMDLTCDLNSNPFWQKNASTLVPLLTAALNDIRDCAQLLGNHEQWHQYSLYDRLSSASVCAGLDIFPVMLLLVGGSALMATHSLPLKLDVLPYLVT